MNIKVVFNIAKSGDEYKATFDSPDQGAFGIAIDSVVFQNDQITLRNNQMGWTYQALVNAAGEQMKGEFVQGGMKIPLVMDLHQTQEEISKRESEHQSSKNYRSENVSFINPLDSIQLAGTLTSPKTGGPHPAVILISGSGPQNRDEEVFGHKPFLKIAEYLTKHGIAVLRYDDRGVGESEGNFKNATSFDFSGDAESAFMFLQSCPDINPNQIGLIGHSEGGYIAPIVAANNPEVAFIVLMAGPGIPHKDLLILQSAKSAELHGVDPDFIEVNSQLQEILYSTLIQKGNDLDIENILTTILTDELSRIPSKYRPPKQEDIEKLVKTEVDQLCNPWLKYFIQQNPQDNLSLLTCPVLAINGSLDSQVLPKENLEGIQKALQAGRNTSSAVIELHGHNHLFQQAETGMVEEYSKIEQTISPIFLELMGNWIKQRTIQ